MATPETLRVELDPFAPSSDGDLRAVESEAHQVVETETRELPAYGFDSENETLVGIGSSDGADSSLVRFDSRDRTLVGIGPAERKRAQLAELSVQPEQAEPAYEEVLMPQSEPPGPFVASDGNEDVPDRLPMQKREPWLLALTAILVAAAAVTLLRGVVPHMTAPRTRSATAGAPLPTGNETQTRSVQFDAAAATAAESSAVELPNTSREASQAAAPPAATTQREKQLELAARSVSARSAGTEALGALDVTSNPPAGVVLDGHPLGKAPRIIQLPSGPHTVLFVHPQRGRMSVTVNVRAGRTTKASADF